MYHSENDVLEYVLTKEEPADLVRTVNGLVARHRKDYTLTDVYLYNGKGKLLFSKKKQIA